jgi:hypothetical protein
MFGLFKNNVASEAPPQNQGEVAAGANWQSILSKADAHCDRYREAVAALNVKVICELAPLVRDRSKYESFQHEAIDLAPSIQDELYRSFAINQVKELFRSAGAPPWRELMRGGSRTRLIAKERSKWMGQGSRELQYGSKTPLI